MFSNYSIYLKYLLLMYTYRTYYFNLIYMLQKYLLFCKQNVSSLFGIGISMGNVSLKGFISNHIIIIYWTYQAFLLIYSKSVACKANDYQIFFCFKKY